MNITIGQIAFEAYSKAKQGKTYDDKPIPHWNDVSADVRQAWESAARAVAKATDLGGARIGGNLTVTGDFVGRDKRG